MGMEMLNSRLMNILQELMGANGPLTSAYMAKKINVTSRTIRNDLKELEMEIAQHGATISSIRGAGYCLVIDDDKTFRSYLNQLFHDRPNVIPSTSEERILFIIRKLLLTEKYVKLDELAKELFVSKSTIHNDLREVKKNFQRYDLTLETVSNFGLKVKGNELKLRYCMSEYLFKHRKIWDTLLDCIPNITTEDITTIREIILQQIKKNDIHLSDIALHNLVIHLSIACARIRSKNYIILISKEVNSLIKEPEYRVASEIVQLVENSLQLTFPPSEIAYITIHLLGNKIFSQTTPFVMRDGFEQSLNQEYYHLTIKILDSIERKLRLGIRYDVELIAGISSHLKPAMNRHLYAMNIRNPILEAIKRSYPIAFEAGILASIVIKEETNIEIDENEIGYIALHIGAAIERKRMNQNIKRCVIICASGVGSASFLKYKLQSEFGAKLHIVSTTEYYRLKEIPFHTLDFVISTIPIQEKLPIRVIEVNVLLGKGDFSKISEALKGKQLSSLDYTMEELVFLQQNIESKEEVLHFLVEKLQGLNLVPDNFLEAVKEREAFSPTSYGNLVAIPHPISPMTETTFWTLCTLQRPIDWGGKRVQFICLLCVEKDCTEDLKNMYDLLINIIESEKYVNELLLCETYSEFENVFLKKR